MLFAEEEGAHECDTSKRSLVAIKEEGWENKKQAGEHIK